MPDLNDPRFRKTLGSGGTLTITSPAPGVLTGPLAAIEGTAAPGAVVFISIDGGDDIQVTAVPTTMSKGAGRWSWPVRTQPPVGAHTVRAQTSTGSVTVSFTRPEPERLASSDRFPKEGKGGTPDAAPPPVLAITEPADQSTAVSISRIAGTAAPAAVVSVVIDGGAPLTVTAGADGAWAVASPTSLARGSHTVVASTGGTSVTVTAIVSPGVSNSPTPGGIPDWVWAGGAVLVALWWAWRVFSKPKAPAAVEAGARENPGDEASMKLQTIIISKDRATSKSDAREIAAKFARNAPLPAADETGRSYRFRQRDPKDFVPNSFRTINPTEGVALVLGHLKRAA